MTMTQEELQALRTYCVDDAAFAQACALIERRYTTDLVAEGRRPEIRASYRSLTQTMFDSSSVGVFVLDADFKIVMVNRALEIYFGLRREDVIGRDKRTLINNYVSTIIENHEHFVEKVFATYDNNTYTENFDCHVLSGPNREDRWLEHWSEPIPTGLFAGGRIEHYTDITRRREYERALQESEMRMRALIGSIDEIVFEFDADGTYIDIWTTNESILIRPKKQLLGKRIHELFDSAEAEKFVALFRRVIETREPESMEYKLDLLDGSHSFFARITPITTADNRCENVCMLALDITDQKHIEESLSQTVQQMQAVFRAIPDMYFRLDGNGVIVDYISSNSELYAHPEEFLGRHMQDVLPADAGSEITHAIASICNPGDLSIVEYRVFVQGEPRYYEARLVPLESEGSVAVIRDITRRRVAEQEMEASLKNKEILLKEIHHRVKNNLQIISSLLNLQSRYIIDQKVFDILNETAGRVRAMALIHEELYGARDLSHVEFSVYLRTLTSYLFRSYGVDSRNISLNIHTGDISFDIDTTVTCGLIVHELVSNCLKHAFPNGRKGSIALSLTERGDGYYTLVVRDNGIGLPDELQLYTVESLGLQLVRFLARKIEATIDVQSKQGTTFTLHFTDLSSEDNGQQHDNSAHSYS